MKLQAEVQKKETPIKATSAKAIPKKATPIKATPTKAIKKTAIPENKLRCPLCGLECEQREITEFSQEGNPKCPNCLEFVPLPKEESKKPNLPADQLFSTSDGLLIPNENAFININENFKGKQLIIIAAAGFMGTGKSTWLNCIVDCLEKNKKEKYDYFSVGSSAQSQTEGIWYLPYPLHAKEDPDSDILILDLEGTGGLDSKRPQISQEIKKMYLAALLLSSVFTLHTNMRFDATSLEDLEQALLSSEEVKTQLGVEIPEIYICLRDTEVLSIKKGKCSSEEFIAFIGQSLKCLKEQSLLDLKMKILCKPCPPHEFLTKKDCSKIRSSSYYTTTVNFLQGIKGKIKPNHGTRTAMNASSFVNSCKLIANAINSENFKKNFQGSIDEMLVEELNPIIDKFLDLYKKDLEGFANEVNINTTDEDFKFQCKKKLDVYRQKFMQELNSRSTRSIKNSETIKRLILKFNDCPHHIIASLDVLHQRQMKKAIIDKDVEMQKTLEVKRKKDKEEMARMKENYENRLIDLKEDNERREKELAASQAKMDQFMETLAKKEPRTKCSYCTRKLTLGEQHNCAKCKRVICSYHYEYKNSEEWCKAEVNHTPGGCIIF